MRKIVYLIAFALGIFMLQAKAAEGLEASNNLVANLASTLADLKQKTNLPIKFPSILPQPTEVKHYFTSYELLPAEQGTGYTISIDATADCHGIHVCNFGYLTLQQGANPQIYHDMNNQEITIPVKLNRDRKGYFTPGHAMGSFFPATLVWRESSVLYTLSWSLAPNEERKSLIAMANSIIEQS